MAWEHPSRTCFMRWICLRCVSRIQGPDIIKFCGFTQELRHEPRRYFPQVCPGGCVWCTWVQNLTRGERGRVRMTGGGQVTGAQVISWLLTLVQSQGGMTAPDPDTLTRLAWHPHSYHIPSATCVRLDIPYLKLTWMKTVGIYLRNLTLQSKVMST